MTRPATPRRDLAARFRLAAPGLWVVLASLTAAACVDLPTGGDVFDRRDVESPPEPPPLTLLRVEDNLGPSEGGDRVMLRGTGFTEGARVFFGDLPGDAPLALDALRINVTTPAHPPGLVDVRVELPDGETVTLPEGYYYERGLRLTAISPDEGPITGGTRVVVTGRAFTPDTRILIGGRPLEDVRFVDETTITGMTTPRPATSAGRVEVTALTSPELATLPDAFTFTRSLLIDALDPIHGPASGGNALVLTGRGLSAACAVRLGGQPTEPLDFEALSGALTVRVPAGTAGARVDVEVRCPEDATTLVKAYRYDPANVPSGLRLLHLYPAEGPRDGGTLVTVAVRGLSGGELSATIGGQPARVLAVGDGTVTVETPRVFSDGLTVVQLREDARTSNSLWFDYLPPFSLASLDPPFGPTAGGNAIRVNGTGLTRGHRFYLAGRRAEVLPNATGLVVQAPSGPAGMADLRIEAPTGEALVVEDAYEYRASRSRVYGFHPPEGAQAGGRIVRIYGEGFRTSAPRITFGETQVRATDVLDDSLAVVRAPKAERGRVTVRGPGSSLFAMAFRYFDPTLPAGGVTGGPIPEALNVTVVDRVNREPVPDAFVILWDDLMTPYQGVTDSRGQVTFSEILFAAPQMVTAARDGYTTASVVDFDGRDVTLSLIPLSPSSPGNGGGGGGGPAPRDDTAIAGRVTGLDKYVVTPPGSCEARLSFAPGDLCRPCDADDDCSGPDARCTPFEDEGPRCTIGCSTDEDCPESFRCAGVTSAQGPAVQCVPDPGLRRARCSLTKSNIFDERPAPSSFASAELEYRIGAPPGEYAVVCLGGVEDTVSRVFTPLVMGVRRHVIGTPGQLITGQDVHLDIPLTRDLRVRLDGAPVGRPVTAMHKVDLFLDLGAEGHFRFPQRGEGIDANLFQLRRFPAAFDGTLYNATFTAYGRAIADLPAELQSGEGSFVVLDRVGQVFSHALFERRVLEDGQLLPDRLGSGAPTRGIFASAGAPGWLWAPGAGGQIAAFNGTIWGRQQAPTTATMYGVHAFSPSDAWAVGAEGTVVRWDGLRWTRVPVPRDLGRVSATWWGIVAESESVLWLHGDSGVWRWNRGNPNGDAGVAVRMEPELAPGSVRAVAASPDGSMWMVGRGGLLRRWRPGQGTVILDRPGADLHAVAVVEADLVWAVGASGRTLRWNGQTVFELLSTGRRDLHALAFDGPERGWAVGDAGDIWRWDGDRWRFDQTIEHQDLRGVGMSGERTFFAGLPTLVVGPFMQLPLTVNPTPDGTLTDLTLRWDSDLGIDPSFNWITLNHPAQFPFWDIMAAGHRHSVPLPDLQAAWGLQPLWPGENYIQFVRAFVPGFEMGLWDRSLLTIFRWRSWAVAALPLSIPNE